MRATQNRPGPPAASARTSAGSRQEARTEATRRKLLQAAERLFAHDGFEAARLEDIAAEAGYTRGAFYANFESKEDIFFALLEHWVAQRIGEVNALLRQHPGAAEQLRALREYYVQNAKDRLLALLAMEFKLFTLRHPEAAARFRARRQAFRSCGSDPLQNRWADRSRFRAVPRQPRLVLSPRSCYSNIWWIRSPSPTARSGACSSSSLTQF
jgi:AcrR family transcriptional regulator